MIGRCQNVGLPQSTESSIVCVIKAKHLAVLQINTGDTGDTGKRTGIRSRYTLKRLSLDNRQLNRCRNNDPLSTANRQLATNV